MFQRERLRKAREAQVSHLAIDLLTGVPRTLLVPKEWAFLGQPPPLLRSPRSLSVLGTKDSPPSDTVGTDALCGVTQGHTYFADDPALTWETHVLLEMVPRSLWLWIV